MTILGIPDASGGFTIGSSSNIAKGSGGPAGVNMSLDEMIKSRRSSSSGGGAARAKERKGQVTVKQASQRRSERVSALQKTKRQAAINARRGIKSSVSPQAQFKKVLTEIQDKKKRQQQRNRRGRKSLDIQLKSQQQQKASQQNKKGGRNNNNNNNNNAKTVVATITNNAKPSGGGNNKKNMSAKNPSKKAITAAMEAMKDSGFQLPEGMQMTISFAPTNNNNANKGNNNKNNNKNNNNNNKKSNKGGGGRGGGRK